MDVSGKQRGALTRRGQAAPFLRPVALLPAGSFFKVVAAVPVGDFSALRIVPHPCLRTPLPTSPRTFPPYVDTLPLLRSHSPLPPTMPRLFPRFSPDYTIPGFVPCTFPPPTTTTTPFPLR